MTARAVTSSIVVALVVSACGSDDPEPQPAGQDAPRAERAFEPVLDKRLRVGSPEQELAIRCWGKGAPAVVLDAGSADSGINAFSSYEDEMLEPLSRQATVCAYDRAGMGTTAELPQRRRTLKDQAEELDALLAAAKVPSPRVLVGSSWGGFVAVQTARDHPTGVGGVVLLDVPAGNAELTLKDEPALAWDHPENPDRVDFLQAEHAIARDRRSLGDVPVRLVFASDGQTKKSDVRFWSRLSSDVEHVELTGGHDIYADDPAGVTEQIAGAVAAVAGR